MPSGTTARASGRNAAGRNASGRNAAGRNPSRPIRHLAGLDGLRGLAVAAVLAYHLFPDLLPGGFIGVDVFFVISGFLITTLLVGEWAQSGRINLRRFWQRRVRRLVPALITAVLLCCSAAWIIGGDVLVGIGRQVLGAATFSSNWLSIGAHASYFGTTSIELFRNVWSLAVEEQFYLLWPLLLLAVLLIRNVRMRIAVVALLAIASGVAMFLLYQPGVDATRVYFGSDTHSFGLALGAALALIARQVRPLDLDAGEDRLQAFARVWLPTLGCLSLVALAGAAWYLHDESAATYRGGLFAVSVFTAVLVWAGTRSRWLGTALDWAPLRAAGVRSYGIYLWHWPVLVLLQARFVPASGSPGSAWIIGTAALAITLTVAWASYRFLEQPIRRHGFRRAAALAIHRMRDSSRARHVAMVGAVVLGLSAAGTVAAVVSAPSATSAQYLIERGQRAVDQAPAPVTAPVPPAAPPTASPNPSSKSAVSPNPSESTASTDAGAGPAQPKPLPTGDQIVALGDSVMLASAPELQAAFPGISIDAKVSRQMYAAPGILQEWAAAGTLRPVIVIGLGTNGPISPDTLAALQQIAGPERQIVFINVQAPRDWTARVNAELWSFANSRFRTMAVADWHHAIAGHLDLLAEDNIHPGSAGGKVYVAAIVAALHEIADAPPPRHYLPQPFAPQPR